MFNLRYRKPGTRRTEARAVQLKADAERSENAASRQALSSTVDFVGLPPAPSPGAGVDLVTVLEALFEVGLVPRVAVDPVKNQCFQPPSSFALCWLPPAALDGTAFLLW